MKEQEYEQGKWYWLVANDGSGFVFKYFGKGKSDHFVKANECYSEKGDIYPHNLDGQYFVIKDHIKGLATPAQIETCLKAYAEKKWAEIVKEPKITTSAETYYPKKGESLLKVGEDRVSGIEVHTDGRWSGWATDQKFKKVSEFPKYVEGYDEIMQFSVEENKTSYKLFDLPINIGDGKLVTIHELIEVYKKCLDIKTIIG